MFAHFPYLMHAKSEFIFMKYIGGETFYSLFTCLQLFHAQDA